MAYIIVKTTVGSEKEAENLARKIIESRLGACVQMSAIKSTYRWDGKIETSKEFKVEVKTKSSNYIPLQKLIIKNSKYELPEIIAIKIKKGSNKYLKWMDNNC